MQGASPEPESEPEILVIKEDKKRVPAGKEAAIEAEVCSFLLLYKQLGYLPLFLLVVSSVPDPLVRGTDPDPPIIQQN
jgi:hypothetical protein